MNCMLMEQGSHRIVIDCGIAFSDARFGADLIRPCFDALRSGAPLRTAVFVTHGHEDHIGALPSLLSRVDSLTPACLPIHAPPYAIELIRRRLQDAGLKGNEGERYSLHETHPGRATGWGPFSVRPHRVAHSIPDSTALEIETTNARIVHTGDFKLQPEGQGSDCFDPAPFAEMGTRGVDLLLSDSTNVQAAGNAEGEAETSSALREEICAAPGRVVATFFASNVARLSTLLQAARAAGRSVALLGRSVTVHHDLARRLGRLEKELPPVLPIERLGALPRERQLILASGSQCEPVAALARLSRDGHPGVRLAAGDTVLFSSRMIPGNERQVLDLMERLARRGLTILDPRTLPRLHVSGHAHREDQRRMIGLLQPHSFLPVHGTWRHLLGHADLARELGVPDVHAALNGEVMELRDRHLHPVGHYPTGRVHMRAGSDLGDDTLAIRASMARAGLALVRVSVDEAGMLTATPQVSLIGTQSTGGQKPDPRRCAAAIQEAIAALPDPADGAALHACVLRSLRKALDVRRGARPHCVVEIGTPELEA